MAAGGDGEDESVPHAHGHAHGVHGHAHGAASAELAVHTGYSFRSALPAGQAQLLELGSGRGKQLFFDCPSGISGDMTLSALLDLGVPRAVVDRVIVELGLEDEARLVVERGLVGAIFATRVKVEVRDSPKGRTYAEILALIRGSRLNSSTVERALLVFDRLAQAEAEVHGVALELVTFHEVGATDSIVDIVGAAAALDFLGATLVTSPLPLGRGFARTQHGRLPLPAPATLLCLRGVPTVADPLELELVTPTGAAIVSALSDSFVSWPALVPEQVGWGAGTLELPDRPNVLRAVLGRATAGSESGERVLLLEANIDDMTGEVLSHALGRLLEHGALDAWIVPIIMKKGRPAFTLCALARPDQAPAVEAAYFAETTTLGVRRRETLRTTLSREVSTVSTRFGAVPVKQSGSAPHHLKPEFDACVEIAKRHGVPVREVLEEALAQARSRR